MAKRMVRTRAKSKKDVAAGQHAAKVARVTGKIERYKQKLKKYEGKLAAAEAEKAELLHPPKLKRVKGADEPTEPVARKRQRARAA